MRAVEVYMANDWLVGTDAAVLVTGAGGFIGRRVVASLLENGFKKIRCLARPSARPVQAHTHFNVRPGDDRIDIVKGNLLSREDCIRITKDVQVIYHLAAGRGDKSFPGAYLNSVVTTRNLLDACLHHGCLKRFVNVSSFAVYSNQDKPNGRVLDEDCPIEEYPALSGSPYSFAKVKQEELVSEYGKAGLPYINIRPGVVYGPGNEQIHGRVGIGTFGVFLHLGGSNKIPLSYVDNCAEAIVLAGLAKGVEGEAFNIVDDDLPSSRHFLSLYKKNVKRFRSIYVPRVLSYALCYLWEKYSAWSHEQLPNAFNRRVWHTTWDKTIYTNDKLKQRLGWKQKISTSEGLQRYFESCREKMNHA
jgi:nucleoside-diphosphate-sugar epimerase